VSAMCHAAINFSMQPASWMQCHVQDTASSIADRERNSYMSLLL